MTCLPLPYAWTRVIVPHFLQGISAFSIKNSKPLFLYLATLLMYSICFLRFLFTWTPPILFERTLFYIHYFCKNISNYISISYKALLSSCWDSVFNKGSKISKRVTILIAISTKHFRYYKGTAQE